MGNEITPRMVEENLDFALGSLDNKLFSGFSDMQILRAEYSLI